MNEWSGNGHRNTRKKPGNQRENGTHRSSTKEAKSYSWVLGVFVCWLFDKTLFSTSILEERNPFLIPAPWNVYLLLTTFYCVESTLRSDGSSTIPSRKKKSCWERHKLAKNISFTDKNLSRSWDISRDDIFAPRSMSSRTRMGEIVLCARWLPFSVSSVVCARRGIHAGALFQQTDDGDE